MIITAISISVIIIVIIIIVNFGIILITIIILIILVSVFVLHCNTDPGTTHCPAAHTLVGLVAACCHVSLIHWTRTLCSCFTHPQHFQLSICI